jgi:DNA-binding LacI/PurR family transcriptional regulator
MLGLARHLAGLGHRRIGVLCMRLGTGHHDGPADLQRQENALYPVQRDRLAGLRDGFAEVGVEWARVPVIERFYHSIEAGEQGTAELLAAHPEVTAVVCTSDVLALGALQHAAEQRLKVPVCPKPNGPGSPPCGSPCWRRAGSPGSSSCSAATATGRGG